MEPLRIYHVVFRDAKSFRGVLRSSFFFGSLAAIYENFTVSDIGCKVGQLYRRIQADGLYVNKKCSISQEVLIRKKQIEK